MTDREIMQQALEALEDAHAHMEHYQDEKARERAIAALRDRLSQPEPKPATYQSYGLMGGDEFVCSSKRNITG